MSVRKLQGFTIFEMMITVAIASILAAFAVPAFQDMMARNRVGSTAQETVNLLATAKNTAVTRRRTVVMLHSAGGWEMRLDSKTGQLLQSQGIASPVEKKVWHGATETDVVNEIHFRPNGYVERVDPTPAAPLTLNMRICDSASRREVGRTVSMSRIGRITMLPHADATECNP
jgi:type IV fimbrial biogenesis protein FimT